MIFMYLHKDKFNHDIMQMNNFQVRFIRRECGEIGLASVEFGRSLTNWNEEKNISILIFVRFSLLRD